MSDLLFKTLTNILVAALTLFLTVRFEMKKEFSGETVMNGKLIRFKGILYNIDKPKVLVNQATIYGDCKEDPLVVSLAVEKALKSKVDALASCKGKFTDLLVENGRISIQFV